MENSYTRYLELQERSDELNDIKTRFAESVVKSRGLICELAAEFEYIRAAVSELETKGNTELIKVYSIQTEIDDLSSRINQLKKSKDY